ncbi:hypothetical protein [Ruminococcus sp. YE78]|nr:hypothetical protein [Ruminococcus sp. YE78]
MCEIMYKISRKADDEAERERMIKSAMAMIETGKLSHEKMTL